MSRTLEIRKIQIRNLVFSFLLGFGILFGLEHFGKFEYEYESNYTDSSKPTFSREISYDTKVTEITYKTYFNKEVSTDGNGFTIADLNFADTEFNNYPAKSYYYTQAAMKDLMYGVYISFALFIVSLFFTTFKIKII